MSNWEHEVTGVDWASMKLAECEMIFQSAVKNAGHSFERPPFAILWEDPADPDAPAKVTTPSPVWWAMALHGGMLPPVEVYWALAHDEAQPGFTRHSRGHLLHDTPPVRAIRTHAKRCRLADVASAYSAAKRYDKTARPGGNEQAAAEAITPY